MLNVEHNSRKEAAFFEIWQKNISPNQVLILTKKNTIIQKIYSDCHPKVGYTVTKSSFRWIDVYSIKLYL